MTEKCHIVQAKYFATPSPQIIKAPKWGRYLLFVEMARIEPASE